MINKKTVQKAILTGVMITLGLFTGCSKGEDVAVSSNGGEKGYTIGLSQFADHPSLDNCREGFIEGLRQEGFEEGKNLTISYQNAQGDIAIANQIAQDQISKNYDLLGAIATPSAQAVFNGIEGKDQSMVYISIMDPIRSKLANEDGTPRGKATGSSNKLPVEEQLKLIRTMLPEAKKVGTIYNTSEVNSQVHLDELKELAPKYGFEIVAIGVSSTADVPMAVDSLLTQVDCINNSNDNLVVTCLSVILDKANSKGIPVFGSEVEQVVAGCVASQSLDYVDVGIQAGKMAARILNGEDASKMPFEIVNESELVINEEAMKKLNIVIPKELEGNYKVVNS